jgi:hypothetical protein
MDTLDEYKQVANYSHNKRSNKFKQHHQPQQLARMRSAITIRMVVMSRRNSNNSKRRRKKKKNNSSRRSKATLLDKLVLQAWELMRHLYLRIYHRKKKNITDNSLQKVSGHLNHITQQTTDKYPLNS